MANKIQSGSSSDQWTINTDKEGMVALSKILAKAGYAAIVGQNDSGSVTGTAQARAIRASLQQRMSAGIDTLLDSDTFNYTAQHTGKSTVVLASMAASFASNSLQLNSSSVVAANTGIYYQTRQYFPFPYEGALILEMNFQTSAINISNQELYFGFFAPQGSTSLPNDGVYLKILNSGFFGVYNNNGSETVSSAFSFTPSVNTNIKLRIVANTRQADFYINDVLQATVTAGSGVGSGAIMPSFPLLFQMRITGTNASGVNILKVMNYAVWSADTLINKPYSAIKALQGNSHQGQQGGTMGSLANYANSTNPGAAVPTNTTAALGTGLGGQFWETDTLAANTDGIISSFQVPFTFATIPGKNLLIHGLWIDTYVSTALTGGGYNEQWTLAYGHTAVSLATAEAATTKAPRRVPIGSRTVAAAAAALTQLTRLTLQLTNPIVVYPGEFLAVVKKKVGSAPSVGVMSHMIGFDHVFE